MDNTKRAGIASQLSAAAILAATLLPFGAFPASTASAQRVPPVPHEKYVLPNGLEVILHQDRSVPLVAVNTWYKVGSADEKPGRTGFAHLFEHIMFMGSVNAPYPTFDTALEAAGARNNGSTNTDRTNYYEWMPSNALPLALWLDADRMGWMLPTMDQRKMDLQRDVVKNERRQSVDNVPYGRAWETIHAALYPRDHPYNWPVIGSMEDLGAATLADVTDFFRTYYAPNNATLVIAGDFDRDSAKVWVRRYFGAIPRGPDLPPRPTVPPVAVPRDTFLVNEDRVQLPRLDYAWHTVKAFHADDASLDILAYILAGDKNSRLYRKLVYEMQVAQEVTAFQVSGLLDGSFMILVTPKPGHTPSEMARLVNDELRKLETELISDRELTRAINTYKAGFFNRIASVSDKADFLNLYNYYVGDPSYFQKDLERYERVTAESVRKAVTTYLAKPKVVLTTVPLGKTDLMVTGGER
jgi:zinc protease